MITANCPWTLQPRGCEGFARACARAGFEVKGVGVLQVVESREGKKLTRHFGGSQLVFRRDQNSGGSRNAIGPFRESLRGRERRCKTGNNGAAEGVAGGRKSSSSSRGCRIWEVESKMERTGGGQAVGSRQARAQVACRGKNEAEAGVASEVKKKKEVKREKLRACQQRPAVIQKAGCSANCTREECAQMWDEARLMGGSWLGMSALGDFGEVM